MKGVVVVCTVQAFVFIAIYYRFSIVRPENAVYLLLESFYLWW